ncbi:hypothetical protein DIPPA_14336 [Diplonema papillatum]|nr:hypothetical protein DIPPA_14336 [Diplonema papillatum]
MTGCEGVRPRGATDMEDFQASIRKKFLFLKHYRESLSILVTGSLCVSIASSLLQVASSLLDTWQVVASLAALSLPWTLSFFALTCAWWCLLPPADPMEYVRRLNDGIRFLNLYFDERRLCVSRLNPVDGSGRVILSPTSPPSTSPPNSPVTASWKLGNNSFSTSPPPSPNNGGQLTTSASASSLPDAQNGRNTPPPVVLNSRAPDINAQFQPSEFG